MSAGCDGLIVMGVSGCGKSTVGRLLAERLGWQFFDADDYHSAENIEKMRSGIPLTDADRLPWLETLRTLLSDSIREGSPPVLACSALKESYRERLLSASEQIAVIYLKGTREELLQRLVARSNHFMSARLLDSQLQTLEEPCAAWTYGINRPAAEIVEAIALRVQERKTV